MENTNENPHLNIETVTPETEKDGQPNDQKHNHRVENEGANDSDQKPETDNPEGTGDKEPYAIYEKPEQDASDDTTQSDTAQSETTESNSEEADDASSDDKNTENKNTNNPDDSGTDIETVAP